MNSRKNILRLKGKSNGFTLVELLVDNLDRVTATGGSRLEFDASHYFTSCEKLIS